MSLLKGEIGTHTHRREHSAEMEAEMRVCFHERSTPEIANRPPEARGQAASRGALRAPRRSTRAGTLVSELQPLELQSKKFLVLTLVSLWYFGTTALENQHTCTLGRPWPGDYRLLTACSLAGWRGGGQLNRNFLAVMKVTAGVLGLVCESTMHTPSFSKLYSSSRVHAC